MSPRDGYFAVDRTCPSCGTSWEERNDSDVGCPNGCSSVPSESHSAEDARHWNEQMDRYAGSDW